MGKNNLSAMADSGPNFNLNRPPKRKIAKIENERVIEGPNKEPKESVLVGEITGENAERLKGVFKRQESEFQEKVRVAQEEEGASVLEAVANREKSAKIYNIAEAREKRTNNDEERPAKAA